MLKFTLKQNKSILINQSIFSDNNLFCYKKNFSSNKCERLSTSPEEFILSKKIAENEALPSSNDNNVFYHLHERNLICNITNKDLISNPKAAKEFLKLNPKLYIGFDPTAEALHLGNLVGIITALRFACYGVNPVFLLGGATGQIGDPSGKNKERPLLEVERVKSNLNYINTNIQKILKNICDYKDFNLFYNSKHSGVYSTDSSEEGEILNLQKILKQTKSDTSGLSCDKGFNNIDDFIALNPGKSSFNNSNTSNPSLDSITSAAADYLVQEKIQEMKELRNIINAKDELRSYGSSLNSSVFKPNMPKKLKVKCDIIDNLEFYKDLNILDFLRSVGTSLRMGPMLSRESIKNRINSTDGMSLTEFMYQTFQGFDYLKLFELFNVRIQIGGSDQWGNMLAGLELIKKAKNVDVVNLTFPLLTTANGQKFGKSEGNAFYLNENLTPINNIYQYFYNIQDSDLEKLFYAFTFIEKGEIEDIINFHQSQPESRSGQKILAEKIVSMIYSEDEALKCKKKCQTHYMANKLKSEKNCVENIDALFKDMEIIKLPSNFIDSKIRVSQLCIDYRLLDTKAAYKRLLQAGAIVINDNKMNSDVVISQEMLLGNKYLVVKTGKKHTHVFAIESELDQAVNKATTFENGIFSNITSGEEITLNNQKEEILKINNTENKSFINTLEIEYSENNDLNESKLNTNPNKNQKSASNISNFI